LAGVPIRAGVEWGYKRNLLLTHKIKPQEYMRHLYQPFYFADILKNTIGIDLLYAQLETLFFNEPSNEDYQSIQNMITQSGYCIEKPYLACSPTTDNYLKDWPKENWQQLFKMIYKKFNIPTVLFDNNRIDEFNDISGIINLCGKTTLKQAACIVKNSKLVLSSCGLPAHMAVAFKIPSIILYGFSNPEQWAPRNNCTIMSAKLSCSPCRREPWDSPRSNCNNKKCMYAISIHSVYYEVEKKLKELLYY
jgi:ADP-heptose:LPS heptosyltransferase